MHVCIYACVCVCVCAYERARVKERVCTNKEEVLYSHQQTGIFLFASVDIQICLYGHKPFYLKPQRNDILPSVKSLRIQPWKKKFWKKKKKRGKSYRKNYEKNWKFATRRIYLILKLLEICFLLHLSSFFFFFFFFFSETLSEMFEEEKKTKQTKSNTICK